MVAIEAMSEEDRGQVDIFEMTTNEGRESVLGQTLDPFRARSIVKFWIKLIMVVRAHC